MGEYFKDRKDEEEGDEEETPKRKSKKPELIKNFNQLIATYSFENERFQRTIDKDYERILPARQALLGGEKPGMIDNWETSIKTSKLRELTLVMDARAIVKEIRTLADWDVAHIEETENHARHYQFICDSAIEMIKAQQEEINELAKENEAMKAEIGKEVENEPEGPPLDERRMIELERFYDTLSTSFEFAGWMNPKRQGKQLTEREREYLKEYNKKMQKFVGKPHPATIMKEKIGVPIEDESNPNLPASIPLNFPKSNNEPQVYSPLSQKQSPKKPLSDGSNENPEPDEKSEEPSS